MHAGTKVNLCYSKGPLVESTLYNNLHIWYLCNPWSENMFHWCIICRLYFANLFCIFILCAMCLTGMWLVKVDDCLFIGGSMDEIEFDDYWRVLSCNKPRNLVPFMHYCPVMKRLNFAQNIPIRGRNMICLSEFIVWPWRHLWIFKIVLSLTAL